MDPQSVRRRVRNQTISYSTSHQLKYERERLELQRCVTEQLVSDVLSLFEKSLFVDVKLETSRGSILSHQLIFVSRVPSFWKLLLEIAKFQRTDKDSHEDLFAIQLPDINYQELQGFIRSLYTNETNKIAGVNLRKQLEDKLAVLQQRALLCSRHIHIQKLSSDEESVLQQLLLQQLQSGQLSEQKGNVRDVQRLFRSDAPRCRHVVQNVPSDTDTNSTTTLTSEATKYSPSVVESVRPKSSQRNQSATPKALGNTMNITNHCVLANDKSDTKERQRNAQTSFENYDNKSGNDVTTTSKFERGSISLKGTVPTKRATDDPSPTGRLSNQESPVFNVSMIKELQTSPMQVSGETFQAKDKKDTSPQATRSSNTIFTPVEFFQEAGSGCYNGHLTPIKATTQGNTSPQTDLNPKGKPYRYGAMSSTRENASLHQASTGTKHPDHRAATSKSNFHLKGPSFSGESQDSCDLDNAISNSGSENRLSNLHETSSLEVELPSSHEENSTSHDSEGSSISVGHQGVCQTQDSEYNKENELDDEEDTAYPKRPLVRARTFEVFEPILSGAFENQNPAESPEKDTNKSDTKMMDLVSSEISSNPHVSFGTAKGIPTSRSEERYTTGNGKERKISDEVVGAYSDNVEDPEKLREIERKKGSLLFEHNFQTYSNIPTTNMMTASMMTASISSESSMGVPSLYSSMMDSALLSSIHSLGGLDAAMGDPLPRPASVGLPVMHQMEDPSPDMVCVPTPHPQGYTGHMDMAQNMDLEMSGREQGTRSPSPDSLSVDFAAKRELEVNYRSKHGRKNLRDECMSPLKKEEMDTEEKERDDRENESCSDNSNIESKDEARDKRTDETQLNAFSSMTGSPRLSRMENTPIISGGSTLKREKETTDMKPIPKCERQVSMGSVKDVDAIPLVFGFIGPQDEEEEAVKSKEEAKKEAKSGEDEDKHPQSIFSMFIDLNEIPSPSKEKPKETEHKEASKNKSASSAVYMYIEADTPSPKTRRKRKSESDGLVMSKSVDIPPDSEFTSLPPVLSGTKESKASTSKKDEANESSDGGGKEKEKKGFFVFIETDSSSKGSPKPRRRPTPPAKKKETTNPMTRSAPSDSLVFSSQDSPSKLMTKSVIDRDEFISQPPSRKNVSVNDKINESSSGKEFVSGIPRPIRPLKSIQSATTKPSKAKPSQHKRNGSTQRDASKDEPTETNDMATSRDISDTSELGPSQSVSLSSQPPDTDGGSEVSNISSLLSSIDRSNDPSSDQVADPHARLGDDLLRMLLNEINTDVTIQIGEKRIRAHKCILASRCVYFAAMLSGHWVESAGNVIKLQGFSHECVMVALKHIYSGTSTVPEGVRVGELAALADMLALDGLKDVISLHLKAKMCHYFHKPCSGCLEGVLDVLPITGAYCLDELYHRCLKWVAKHFVVVLPTRNFAALPPEVQDRCLKQLLDDMSVGNVIDTALGCERVLSSLPMVRWAQPVFDSAAQLLESATSFIAANLSGVLASDRFLALGKDSGWSIDSLEETMRVACELVRPDQAVLAHLHLAKLLEQNEEDGLGEVSESFLNFLENLLNQVEKFMIHNANRVAVCRKWPLLSTSTQRRIKDAAMVVVEFSRPTVPRPKLSSSNRRTRGSSSDGGGGGGSGGGIATRGSEHRLMRSASATAVPSSHRTTPRRPPSAGGGQDPSRCQTPPARLSRLRTQTPPPTRASTLRAQARQAAIQRSQSARTVAETRPCRPRQGANNSTDEDSHSSGRRTSSVAGTFTRGATFTRSLSRPEPSRPQSQTSTRLPSSSRPRTPGPSEPSHLPRRTSVSQRAASNTIPRTRSTEARTPAKFSETRSSTSSLSRAGGRENQSRISGTTDVQSSPSTLGTSRSPRTPRMGDQRTKCDSKNGNITKGSNVVRRSARSPMREVGQSAGRNCTPSPLTSDGRSRSSSITSKTMTNTANTTPPSLGSRSNTFCKDDKDCANKNAVGP